MIKHSFLLSFLHELEMSFTINNYTECTCFSIQTIPFSLNVISFFVKVDVIVFQEFLTWMEERKFDSSQPFLSRVHSEDVVTCLDFTNKQVRLQCTEIQSSQFTERSALVAVPIILLLQ